MVPTAGCSSFKEALASKTGCPFGGELKTLPGGAAADFSKPTLDSVHTEFACVWSLGRLHGSSISIGLEGKRERKKYIQIAERQLCHWFLKTQEHEHTQASPETATHVRHRDTETHLCVQRHTCTQRQLRVAGIERHSC